MTPEIERLIRFLRDSGYPGIAHNIEDAAQIADDLQAQANLGLTTPEQDRLLEVHANFAAGLRTLDWLRG